MVIKNEEYGKFDVYLGDDGTLDTVVEVSPHNDNLWQKYGQREIHFSTEYAVDFRDGDGAMTDEGFAELAQEAVEAYIEQYLC